MTILPKEIISTQIPVLPIAILIDVLGIYMVFYAFYKILAFTSMVYMSFLKAHKIDLKYN